MPNMNSPQPRRRRLWRRISATIVFVLALAPQFASAQIPERLRHPVGGRAEPVWQIAHQSFHLTTALRKFSARELTYTVRSGPLWASSVRRMTLRWAANVGQLESRSARDVLLGIGPLIEFRPRILTSRTLIEFGSGVHWIDGDGFADESLGQRLQFQSHVALGLAPWRQRDTLLMVRVQHISNAGLAAHNPGLDLAGLELRHRFGG